MKVRLISHTQPSEEMKELGVSTLQDLVVYCGRVSNPSNQRNVMTGEGLLKYLVSNNEWSPFEMAHICLEIETSRDIGRQILRHRSFSFAEFSQRYQDVTKLDLDWIFREARLQDTKNRQGSLETDDDLLMKSWRSIQEGVVHLSLQSYEWALHNGIAKEVARAVLPEGMTPSRLYMNGSVRSWLHYLTLRLEWKTQKEHREVADACKVEIAKIFPLINSLTISNKE